MRIRSFQRLPGPRFGEGGEVRVSFHLGLTAEKGFLDRAGGGPN